MRNMIIRSNSPKPPLNPRGGVRNKLFPPLNVKRGRGGVKVLLLTVALLLCGTVALSEAYKLPDTGQTTCYQWVSPYADDAEIPCSGTGQDGAYAGNQMSFIDNGNGTVTDNNTGLIWQKQDDGMSRWWAEAVSYCASLSLPGIGWRLPTKKELMSIVDYSIPAPGPAIQTVYFPNTKGTRYWSSTTAANGTNLAWNVSFYSGYVATDMVIFTAPVYVRCVRSGQ